MHAAHGKERGADFLRGNFFAALAFQAKRLFIVGHGLIQGLDGDSEMVNFCNHKLLS